MMWTLTIIACLANGPVLECDEWTVRPFDKREDCLTAQSEAKAEIEALNPLHMSLRCERGLFG